MCQPASMLITKRRVLWSVRTDSHTELRAEHGLREEEPDVPILAVAAELEPPDFDFSRPPDEWQFHVDQDLLPDWWDAEQAERRARHALNDWIAARVIQPGEKRMVWDGLYYALPGSIVGVYKNSRVTAYGDSKVAAYNDSVVIACDRSSVFAYDHSSVVARHDSSVVAHENSIVTASDRSRVTAHDSSAVTANGSANVSARDDSIIAACDQSVVVALDRSTVISYDERVSVDTSQSTDAVAIFRWRKENPRVHISGREAKVS